MPAEVCKTIMNPMIRITHVLLLLGLFLLLPSLGVSAGGEVVSFPRGGLTLQGMLYKPEGTGPFPAVVYNHGSAPGMLSEQAFEALGPVFVRHGWVFFGPYRRGQGRSASAGPYIGEEIAAATKKGGVTAGAATMVRLLETDHLNDQLAALAWLRMQNFVKPDQIAVAGILSVASRQSWDRSAPRTVQRWIRRAPRRVGQMHQRSKL